MTLTLLLDLDGTLLDNNVDIFIPAYFRALSGALEKFVEPQAMLSALMAGTRLMLVNENPALTLREVFDAHFFPALGLEREHLQAEIDSFYEDVFPSLKQLTKLLPGAVELVEWAFLQGYRVVVATNPLFPREAIYHRLRWAGLSPESYPFALISSYDSFHFTKSTPAFYTEVLAQLGWPDDPVVMVGDDITMDLIPVSTLGIPAFWIQKPGVKLLDGVPVSGQGGIGNVRAWIESLDLETCKPNLETPEALIPFLRSTPAALSSQTRHISPEKWNCRPNPDEWCLVEVVCHLRDVEREVNLARIEKILAEDNPFIPGQVTDAWIEARDYARQDGPQALADFVTARTETVRKLSTMDVTSWQKPARHNIFGPTVLQELMSFSAEHDRDHVRQVVHGLYNH